MNRRRVLLAGLGLPALSACGPALPPLAPATATDAAALLRAAAAAHGDVVDMAADTNGQWRPIVGRLQPDLVDETFRGTSRERYRMSDRLVSQDHNGPAGNKRVIRRMGVQDDGTVEVTFNGVTSADPNKRAAAALVADAYALFLYGPALLAGPLSRDRALTLGAPGPERITVGDEPHWCDMLRVQLRPGLGFSASDDLVIAIDRAERLMRRVRFTLNGLESTRGAIAEVDCWGYRQAGAARIATYFHERLIRPFPLPVHNWSIAAAPLASLPG